MAHDDVARIRKLGWPKLQQLWRNIREKNTPDWEPGKAFEHLALRMFELDGAEVTWPFSVRLNDEEVEQIDGAIYCNGLSCLVECKDQADPVNFEPIAKLRNQLLRRPSGVFGIVLSTSGYTSAAELLVNFTSPQAVLLWDGVEIEEAIERKSVVPTLLTKYREFIEQGVGVATTRRMP